MTVAIASAWRHIISRYPVQGVCMVDPSDGGWEEEYYYLDHNAGDVVSCSEVEIVG
jgi:hypothetical protein